MVAKINPKSSSCAYILVELNYNKSSITLPGITDLLHSKSDMRPLWAIIGEED